MQVGLHELEDQVEVALVASLNDPLQPHDVGVVQLVQHAHLPVGALRIHVVLEGVEHLLQGVLLAALPVSHPPNVPVRPAPQELLHLEDLQHVILDLFAHNRK
jgi:hypothetical protein